MKKSLLKLSDIKGLIPAVFRSRYSSDFLIFVANEVLGDIEQECDPDYFKEESAILLKDSVTQYPLPDNCRHVRGLFQVPAGGVQADREHAFKFDIISNNIRFLFPALNINANPDISADVLSATGQDWLLFSIGKCDADEFVGRLIRVFHVADGIEEDRIIAKNTASDQSGYTTIYFNGDLDEIAAGDPPDQLLITDNFLILEHTRYLHRFGDVADVLPIPKDFEKLLRAGVTFKYHFQADELSSEAKSWKAIYEEELDRFRIETTKPKGAAPRNMPRSMPAMYA